MSDFAHLALGEVFAGRYQVEHLIAAGGMGAVYASVHTGTLRKVALKVMRPEIVADAGARQRFAKEAQVSARLESPNVVDVLDAGIDPATGIPFFAMELLVGKELGELLRERGRLAPQDVFSYLTQAARALDKAHGIGIVHRDLKPENLFLVVREGEAPMIKVLDFGIARILEGASNAATMAGGTPLYMAPEQTSRSSNIGPQTDVWALALTAYTLLVGRPYWRGGDSLMQLYGEVLTAPLESPVARAAEVGVQLPPTFDAWFYRCVDRDGATRLARAGECVRQLGETFGYSATPTPQQFAPPAPPPSPSYRPPPAATPYGAPPAMTPPAYGQPIPTAYGQPGPAAYGPPPNAGYGQAGGTAYGAPPPAAYGPPIIPPNNSQQYSAGSDARVGGRTGGGIPMPALAALAVVAIGVIGFGVFAALRGSSSPETTTTAATTSDETKNDKTAEDDDDKKAKKKPSADDDDNDDKTKKKPATDDDDEPTDKNGSKADPKPLDNAVGDDPTPAPTPTPPPVPKPTFTAPKTPPKPPPPKQNCSPGTINTMGRCTCPAGFRSVGPSGSARCVPDDPDEE